jgi:MSHA biogenesis protein MshI
MLQMVSARVGRLFNKRRRVEGLRAAVAISDTEIAVALVRKLEGQRPEVLRIVVEEAPLGFADPVLKKFTSEFDLRRVPVSAVINAADYQLAQVQAPDVPRNELRAAARYSMRDAFDFPIEHATLDIFDLPEQTSRGSKKMCFAIASRGDAIAKMTQSLERHFRKFDVIDIPELCQRNLAALLPQDAKGVAFLLIRDDFAQLVLTRRGMLYVTRRFDFGMRGELNGDPDTEANELPLDPQLLSLELQRSLDYYESHFDETLLRESLRRDGHRGAVHRAGRHARQPAGGRAARLDRPAHQHVQHPRSRRGVVQRRDPGRLAALHGDRRRVAHQGGLSPCRKSISTNRCRRVCAAHCRWRRAARRCC